MLSLKEFIVDSVVQIDEGNLLQQRVNKHLAKGVSIGAVSPEGPHTDSPEKLKSAHDTMKNDLESARKSGHIGGWSGPHKGEYKYLRDPSDRSTEDISHESSYLVHAKDESQSSHHNMIKSLKNIGSKHNQESVLSVDAKKKANWHYLKGEKEGTREYKGKVHYDLPTRAATKTDPGRPGRTELKRGGHSFTSE